MENNFKKMYKVMGILGELLGLGGAAYFVFKNEILRTDFYILFAILFVLLITVRIMYNMKKRGKFEKINSVNAAIAKGHLSMMFGVCMMVVSLMHTGSNTFINTLAIAIIVIVFMSFMLAFMINTFTRLQNMVEESEKK